MRRKMACRSLFLLLLTGVVTVSVNILFLWSQIPSQPQSSDCVCDCTGPGGRSRDAGVHGENIKQVGIKKLIPNSSSTLHASSSRQPLTEATPSSPKEQHASLSRQPSTEATPSFSKEQGNITSPHQLAVVVPFRNRFEEMLQFVPHIHQFLNKQSVRHQIWIVNQVDKHRFNRASLLNIGFLLSRNECDYMVMHDIDLLPLNDDLKYSYPSDGPYHISSPELHPLYHYKTFVGGILSLTREQFEKVNGLSNLFWGWGREDDELYTRMKEAKMKVHYPEGIHTGYHTFKHIHDKEERPRDMKRYQNQWDMSKKKDRKTGLNTIVYTTVSSLTMEISGAPLHFVSVELHCDYKLTPFCDSPS